MSNLPSKFSTIRQWTTILSESQVHRNDKIDYYQKKCTGLERKITAVLQPYSTSDVQKIIAMANETGQPLYPVSCGRNWGYGSFLPVQDDCTLVDLSQMRAIRSIGSDFVEIEPGVTQQALSQALEVRNIPSFFNCTGAGCETSVLGNALDRGFGYLGMKPDDLSCLEVVLGNGTVLNTGFSHYPNASTASTYPPGLGPSLDGLFCQSNFGIVTSARFRLHPKVESHAAAIFTLNDPANRDIFIDRFARLRRDEVFTSVFHFGNPARAIATLGPLVYQFLLDQGEKNGASTREKAMDLVRQHSFSTWTGNTAIRGTAKAVDLIFEEFQKAVGDITGIQRVDANTLDEASPKSAAEAVHRELLKFTLAIPSDATLQAPFWALSQTAADPVNEIDSGTVGVLFCCPTLPFESQSLDEVIRITDEEFNKYGFVPCITCNAVNAGTLIAVINLFFHRDQPDEAEKAHQCIAELYDRFASIGHYPYRVGIQSMDKFVSPSDPFWQTVSSLKTALDPANIIAPGRYSLV